MEANNLFEEICGWTAAGLTLYFFIASSIPFINLAKGKLSIDDTPGFYIGLNYVNSLCWYIYGDFLYSDCIKKVYFTGSIICFALFFVYLFYEAQEYKKDAILNGLIIISGTYTIYVGLSVIIDNVDIIARFCFATYLILFFYPLQSIYYVIKNKDYTLIPFYSTCCSFLTGLCWTIYGYGITEYYVILTNIFVIIIALVQIVLYFIFKLKYPYINIENKQNEIRKEENKKIIDEEVQMNERPVKIIEKS